MQSLRASGVEVALVCRPEARIAALANSMNIPVHALPFRNSLDVRTIFGLRKIIAARRPGACICHSGHDANNLALAARLLGKRRPKLIRSKTYLAGEVSARHYNRFVDCTVTPSQYLRNRILANSAIDPSRVGVLYPGVDFSRLDAQCDVGVPPELASWLAQESGALIVQVGMLRKEKGHVLMLEAIAKLRSRWPSIRFAMIGSGPEDEAIRLRTKALDLCGRVWIGELNCIAPILQAADLAVMPSLEEPLGMAQIEAAGLGVPVIASNVGGIPETISDGATGLLVEPHAEAFARAVDYALSHRKDMLQMANAARADVRARFSVAGNARALLSLIARVAVGGER